MVRNIAVLGGGISGLTAAFTLAKYGGGDVKVHLIETSKRLGGWMQSSIHNLPNGQVTFEAGPRSMRPRFKNGWTSVKVLDDLGMKQEIITVPKDHPSAKNRFIYYPDRLNQMPASVLGFLSSSRQPALKGLLPAIVKEPFRKPKTDDADETLDSFFRRRFGPNVAENLLSAMIHGIYAGDTDQLSMQALFPTFKHFEKRYKSVIRGVASKTGRERFSLEIDQIKKLKASLSDPALVTKLENASVWSLRNGMQAMSDTLSRRLYEHPQVDVKLETTVSSIVSGTDTVKLNFDSGNKLEVDHLITAMPSHSLANLTPELPHLKANPAVTVAVVNLAFDQPVGTRLLPVEGFGYLIPRSTPRDQNPHFALGVVFDSDSMPDLDGADSPFCKVSVLLGGHYYNGREVPSEETIAQHALETVERHLGITEKPALMRVTIQRDCIPQYSVGHVDRMRELHQSIQSGNFQGRLSLLGASYIGVSVNDCIATARETAMAIINGHPHTGLEPLVEVPS